MTTLCLITPTISRPTLRRALTSSRLTAADEWLVVGDGPQPGAEEVVKGLGFLPYLKYVEGLETHDWGNSQRDLAMSMSDRDYFLFVDDDDVLVPGAVETVRRQLDGVPYMFRIWHNGGVIWQGRSIYPGEVARSMFVVPNKPDQLARWADDPNYDSDVTFIKRTLELWPKGCMKWAGEIIQVCKPETSEEWIHLA